MKLACLFLLCLSLCSGAFAQSTKTIKSVRVTGLDSPYVEITVAEKGEKEDDEYLLDSLVKVTKKKGDPLKIEDIAEGSEVSLTYKEVDDEKIVTEIKLLTEPDRDKEKYEAVFDELIDSLAIIGGRRVKLAQGGVIKGKGKTSYSGFRDTALKRGWVMEVDGRFERDGIFYAKEIEARENPRTADDMRLMAFVNNRFSGEGLQGFTESGSSGSAPSNKTKGSIKIGNTAYTLASSPDMVGLINDIGLSLLPAYVNEDAWMNANPDVIFEFYLIEDSIPNAFALANGKVLIHTGLLYVIENSAQLAYIMAHEISHVLYKHGTAQFVKSEKNKRVKKGVDKVAGGFRKAGSALGFKAKRGPTTAESAAVAGALVGGSSSPLGMAVTGGTVLLGTLYKNWANGNFSKPFSKDNEKEADMVALHYTRKAGYDIREVPKFWRNMMQRNSDPTYIKTLGSSLERSASKNLKEESIAGVEVQVATVLIEGFVDSGLNTIYTSHPLSKNRQKATYDALNSIYQSDNFAGTKIGKEEYQTSLLKYKKELKP